jgi:hypothetical protein
MRGSLDIIFRKPEKFGYNTAEIGPSVIQGYAEYMILVADSERNLQILISRRKNFFDLDNIN